MARVEPVAVKGERSAALLTELSLVFAAVFWGANYVAVKYVVAVVPPLLLVPLRFVVAGLLLLGFLRFFDPKGGRLGRGDLLPMLGLGAFGISLCQTTFTYGVSLTSASNTGLVFATSPVWGLLMGLLLGRERPTLRGVLGVGLSIVGVAFVVWRGLGQDGASLSGDLLVLASAILLGTYTVFSMPLLDRYPPLTVAAYPMLFGGLIVLPFAAPGLGRVEWGGLGAGVAAAAAFSVLLATAFAFAAWQTGISRIGANRVLVYQYLITFTGIFAGVLLLGEGFGLNKAVGGAIILVGVYLARRQ